MRKILGKGPCEKEFGKRGLVRRILVKGLVRTILGKGACENDFGKRGLREILGKGACEKDFGKKGACDNVTLTNVLQK